MDTISYAIERFLRKCFSWKISPRSLEDSLEIVEEEVYENRQPVKGRKRRGLFLKAPSEAKAEATFGWGQLKAVCEAVAGLQGRGDHLYNGLFLRVAVNAADDLDKIKVDGAFTKNRKGGLKATDIIVPVALSRTRDGKVNDSLRTVANLILQKDFRRNFVYAIAVEDSQMTLWYFSHSASIKSKPFDYIKDPSTLVNVLIYLMFSTEHELGLDHRISYMPDTGFVYRLGERSYLVVSVLNQEERKASSTSRRLTRVLKAIEIVWPTPIPVRAAPPVILKDTWVEAGRPTDSRIERKVLADVEKFVEQKDWLGVKFVDNMRIDPAEEIITAAPDCVFDSKKWKSLLIRGQLISTGEPEKFQIANSDVAYEPRQLVLYQKEGIRVDRLPNVGEALNVLNYGAYMLYILFQVGWVHGDISIKNILGTEDETPGEFSLLLGTLGDMQKFKRAESEEQIGKFLCDIEVIWWTAVSILSTRVETGAPEKAKVPFKLDKDVKKALQVELDTDFMECLHEDLQPLANKAEEFRARLNELESGSPTKREIYEAAYTFFSGITEDRKTWSKAAKLGLKPLEETFIVKNPASGERWKMAKKGQNTQPRFTKRERPADDDEEREEAKRMKLFQGDKGSAEPAKGVAFPSKDTLKEAIAKFKLPAGSACTWAIPTIAPPPALAKENATGTSTRESPTSTAPSASQVVPPAAATPPAPQEEKSQDGKVPESDTPATNAHPVTNIPTGPREDRGRRGAPSRLPMSNPPYRRAPSQASSASGSWARSGPAPSHRQRDDDRPRQRFQRDRRDSRRY